MAASLEAASAADQSESEADGMRPSASALHGAARHYSLVSKTVTLPPEAKALLESKSLDYQRKARMARPLAEQAEALKKALQAKKGVVERLEAQIRDLQERHGTACAEGLALEMDLDNVNARIVNAPRPAPSPAQTQPTMASALDMVGQLGGVFQGETGAAFAECVRQLQLMLHQQQQQEVVTAASYAQVAAAAGPTSVSKPSRGVVPPPAPLGFCSSQVGASVAAVDSETPAPAAATLVSGGSPQSCSYPHPL